MPECLYTIWSKSDHPICGKPARFKYNTVPLCEKHFEMAINLKNGFRTCNGEDDMECITYHKLHCPKCDKHLTSLGLCAECGTRYEIR